MKSWAIGLVWLSGVWASAADPAQEFRDLVDNRVAVRTSLGVRYARAAGPGLVEVALGLSVTHAADNPVAYRIISRDDANYAYDKFVAPVKALARRELDCEGVEGAPFAKFERRIVALTLPAPMKEGARYTVVAQGASGEMVTAAHATASFVYHAGEATAAPGNAVDLAVLGLRQVMPEGNGVIKLEFGPDFATGMAAKPSCYKIAINGHEVRIVNLGRISKLDTYLPSGWPYAAIPMHEVFVQVEPAYKDGDELTVEVSAALTTAARSARLVFHDGSTFSDALKVNQIGYLEDSPVKMGYLGRWMGSFPELKQGSDGSGAAEQMFWSDLVTGESLSDQREGGKSPKDSPPAPAATPEPSMGPALAFTRAPQFAVIPEAGGKPLFTGTARLVHLSGVMNEGVHDQDYSGENVYQLDFTAFKTPGRYRIMVPGVGCSLPFDIGRDTYRKAFEIQSAGVFAQRCGIEFKPPYSAWQRIACHKKGLCLTTAPRLDTAGDDGIAALPSKVVYEKTAAVEDPEASRLNQDPALVAHHPFNGTLADLSGHGVDLAPALGKVSYRMADLNVFEGGQCLGPTADCDTNGAVGTIDVAASNGLSVAFWFRKSGEDKFEGGFSMGEDPGSRFMLRASWGMPVLMAGRGLSLSELAMGFRPNDGTWHHIVAVLDPATKSPRMMRLYDKGQVVGSAAVGALDDRIKGRLQVANLSGDNAGGACFKDFRIYTRPLGAAEITWLATPHPAEHPAMIQAFGGHHDAGDYNPRSHWEVAHRLMSIYEMAPRKFYDGQLNIPEKGNGFPDILDEAFWSLRLWLDLQDKDGGVRNGTESNGDPSFIQTVELDVLGDYAFAKDANGSYIFAGLMAQASRLWRQNGRAAEADEFLSRARRAYAWAQAHPLKAPDAKFYGCFVASAKAYAAAQLLHTTGEVQFNKDFASSCVWSRKPDADVEVYGQYDMQDAAWAYLMCPPEVADQGMQSAIRAAVIRRADLFGKCNATMGYAFFMHPWAPISWGTGAYENHLNSDILAYYLTKDPKYLAWIVRTCDNTLGANPLCRSWIVGAGSRTVRAPLHNCRYCEAGEVVDGVQEEGPNQAGPGYNVKETAYPPLKENFASLYTHVDAHFAIDMNEPMVTSMVQTMAVFGLLLPDR